MKQGTIRIDEVESIIQYEEVGARLTDLKIKYDGKIYRFQFDTNYIRGIADAKTNFTTGYIMIKGNATLCYIKFS